MYKDDNIFMMAKFIVHIVCIVKILFSFFVNITLGCNVSYDQYGECYRVYMSEIIKKVCYISFLMWNNSSKS